MPRSIEEIKADIAKVQAEIAQRKTYSQPQTRVGWATYMIDNDRGMLDKYADAERAYNNMLMQQEHAKAMQQEQLDNAKELAALQRADQSIVTMDDNMKNRANAVTKQQYAQYELDAAKKAKDLAAIERAKMNLALANNELAYWNKRTGYSDTQPSKAAPQPKEPTPPGASVNVDLERSKAIKRFKTNADKSQHIAMLKALDTDEQNTDVQAEINRINSLDTDENKAARKKKLEEYKAMYTDSTGHVSPGKKAKLLKENAEFAKLYKEFGG